METESKNRKLGGHLNGFWKACNILNKVEIVNTECSNLMLIA